MHKSAYTSKLLTLFVIGISLAAVLSSCSDSTTEDIFPNVSLSIHALNFEAAVESYQIQTVTIKNLSSRDVTIERITSTNEIFRIGGYFTSGELVELEMPFTIEGSGARAVYVGFYPTKAAEYKGKLVVESVDINANRETDLADLTGVGLPKDKTEVEE